MSSITESIDVDVESMVQTSDKLIHWEIDAGGARREFDARITERHPERVAWESVNGPRHAGVVTFHRVGDDQTRVTLQMEIDPEVVENTADARGFLSRRAKRDLRRFKEFIEWRTTTTAATLRSA